MLMAASFGFRGAYQAVGTKQEQDGCAARTGHFAPRMGRSRRLSRGGVRAYVD
jgi:hypothetical protein